MSVTESKAKTERKSSRKPAKTQETVLSALLAQTEEVSVPLCAPRPQTDATERTDNLADAA
ncbi:hypothetical protein K6070_003757 [Escherichia coli]|nr:hypothetical protein [Escherichia coli]EIA0287212.1 hypothetical protein [Escherichia coli]HDX7348668.1 hypothetical protein [Escherichia coli]